MRESGIVKATVAHDLGQKCFPKKAGAAMQAPTTKSQFWEWSGMGGVDR